MKAPDMAIHVVVACSLLVAVGSIAIGYGRADMGYLVLLLTAVNTCLLAGMLFVLERILRKKK